jgi:hypothetical protein
MTNQAATEIDLWSRVTDMLGDGGKRLGPRWSGQLHRDPIELALTLAWAKFAAKMACVDRSVLELGCDEGIRSPILSERADCYVGLDSDGAAIAAADANWKGPRRSFVAGPWLGRSQGAYQTVVCHDVRSFCRGGSYDLLLETALANLDGDGLCVLGLSVLSRGVLGRGAGDEAAAEDIRQLTGACARTFRRVLRFGMNDGLVHTRCTPAAEQVIVLGVCPQAKELDR